MKKQQFTEVGPLTAGLTDQIFIVKNENDDYFFCKDIETFQNADSGKRYRQHINRLISKTVIYSGSKVMQINAFTADEKNTLEALKTSFPESDSNLILIASLCEGADSSDFEKFSKCESIPEIVELKDMGSNLSSGLGFPGRGYAKVTAIIDDGIRREEKMFLQVVHSYMEGYSVEHQELSPELYAFTQLDIVKSFFQTKP